MLNTNRVEKFRIQQGFMMTTKSDGANGGFNIKYAGKAFIVVISNEMGWEHVSISSESIPSWDDMCYFKNLFWHPEDCVLQYHPAASDYVNCYPNCLHLWRPTSVCFPTPPSFMVGPK